MKKNLKILVALFVIFSSFQSCEDVILENDLRNVPVYISYGELRSSFKIEQARDMVNPGKIYFKGGYIFINEEMKGIHVVDNRNPLNPVKQAFINIPGNMDMAIKNNILYADSYIDLVAIDILDVNKPQEIKRIKNIFPYTLPEVKEAAYLIAEVDEKEGVVVDWEIDYSVLKVERKNYPVYRSSWFGNKHMMYDMAYTNLSSSSSSGAGGSDGFVSTSTQSASFGIGGSMARFGLNGDHLYTVDREEFHIFDVSDERDPLLVSELEAGEDIETMFIHDGHMFLGTMTGMLVYTLEDAEKPTKKNSYSHLRSCDPVVVQDHIAYVTLRGGNTCGSAVSSLDIISLSVDYRNETLMHSYSMKQPYGLGIDDEILFVCDGVDGLLVFDASDLALLNQRKLAQFPDIDAFDVIPFEDYLFMIGDDGFYQYDYSDIQNIHEVSQIPVNR